MPARLEANGVRETAPANLRELLRQRTSATPEKTFLFSESDDRHFTYAEFEAAVLRSAALLATHGVGKGDVVSLLLAKQCGIHHWVFRLLDSGGVGWPGEFAFEGRGDCLCDVEL